ncbi:SGNH hydrolase-type esterase domain-containing protein [Microdochium trichocladiopsis]|uniref:SGNH hydrolase-type esterase domain-containing protein n=1 Tax=Microdochium trichocladiopsis TaxID=1682393 RepID=A0A9P9BMP6_9PEZI|nr:SGNH hydrolase-type esterase domain-containing protein [Microdochium trichocladiopsis]KAH7026096.1 SGNH hydrolase-type esterase domain-containing protein [Microdochium trichocladiopsis]
MYATRLFMPIAAIAALISSALGLPATIETTPGGSSHQKLSRAPVAQRKATSLRIMALGASATSGVGSSTSNGYREFLRELLESPPTNSGAQLASIPINFVGSLTSGTMTDHQHEGWRGLEIAEIADKAALAIPKYNPAIVLVLAGTNDCVRDVDVAHAGERMAKLLDDIHALSGGNATAVVATLQPNSKDAVNDRVHTVNDRVHTVNMQYRALVRSLRQQQQQEGGSRRVYLAEMRIGENALSRSKDLADGLHPNDGGYAKMAKVWDAVIRQALVDGGGR